MKTLVILISNAGTGTNLQAIIDAIEAGQLKAKIQAVISGSSDAYGLVRAQKHKLYSIVLKPKESLETWLKKLGPDYIVLAGWKRIIPDSVIDIFSNKILNMHPGVIPGDSKESTKNPDGTHGLWNKGKMTEAAIQSFIDLKATYAGSSVHFLTHDFDYGPVLGRVFEKILPKDTVESLYKRLKKKENELYVKVLKKLSN